MGKYHDYSIEYSVCFPLFILFVVGFAKVRGRKPSVANYCTRVWSSATVYTFSFRIMHLVCIYIVPYIMYLLVFSQVKKLFEVFYGIFSISILILEPLCLEKKLTLPSHSLHFFTSQRELKMTCSAFFDVI